MRMNLEWGQMQITSLIREEKFFRESHLFVNNGMYIKVTLNLLQIVVEIAIIIST